MLNESLLDKKKRYLVGVSGGVDSMALLDILVKKGYQVRVVHYNYHLRNDSDFDEKLVFSYCQKHQIPFYVKQGCVDEYQGNFEKIAREKRYAFYHEMGIQEGINEVILGHHLNDYLENIIMQIKQKKTKGYLGIQEVSYVQKMTILRPLLNVKKEELYRYCQENQVEYHEDYTNYDTSYLRNYIRHIDLKNYDEKELLAYAKRHNENYLKKQEYLKQMMEIYKKQHFLNLNQIKQEDLEDILYEMLKKEIYPPYISQSLIQEIKKQIQSTKPNIEITLPVNFVFTKVYNNIAVRKKEADDTYSIKYKSFYRDQQKHFLLSDTGHIHDGIYLQKEDFPITIRSFQNGDKIITSGGTKKVSRLFIDQKIPKEDRKVWPIVENSQGEIILIPHIAKNIKYLYTKPNVFVIKYDTCK